MVNSFFSTYNEGGTGVINTDGTVSYYTLNPETGELEERKVSKEEQLQDEKKAKEYQEKYVVDKKEPTFREDVKRVALNVADTPFRLASDFVVGPLFKLAGDEDYDYSAQEIGKKRREYILEEFGEDTPGNVLDAKGRVRPTETGAGLALDISTYLVGGYGIFKGLDKISQLNKVGSIGKGIIASQGIEQALSDPSNNIANAIEEVFQKEDIPVIEYLSAKEDNDVLLQRAKMAITSGALEAGIGGLLKLGFKGFDLAKVASEKFGKEIKDLTDSEADEMLELTLRDQREKLTDRPSKVIEIKQKADQDDAEGVAQVINQSTAEGKGITGWLTQRFLRSRGFLTKKAYDSQQEAIHRQRQRIKKSTNIARRLQTLIDDELGELGKLGDQKVALALEDRFGLSAKEFSELSYDELVDKLQKNYGFSANLADEIINARSLIDDLSKIVLDKDTGSEEVAAAIRGNLGQYIRRSYRLFEDEGYVPDADVRKRAQSYLIDVKASAYLKRKNKQLKAQGKPTLTIDDLERLEPRQMRKFRLDSDEQLNKLLARGEKESYNDYISRIKKWNKNNFKERKEIAPEIREFMGEIESPTENLVLTVQKLSNIIESNKFYDRMLELGASTIENPELYKKALDAARIELNDIELNFLDAQVTQKLKEARGETAQEVQREDFASGFVTLKENLPSGETSGTLGRIKKYNEEDGTVEIEFKDSVGLGSRVTRTVDYGDNIFNLVDNVADTKLVRELAKRNYLNNFKQADGTIPEGAGYTEAKYIFDSLADIPDEMQGVFNTQIKLSGSELDGKYTTPQMARAIMNLEDTHLGWMKLKEGSGFKSNSAVRYFSTAKGVNQQMRTVWDHTTHLRNAIGGFQFGLANGINPLYNGKLNSKVLWNDIYGGGNKVFDKYYEKLQGLGIINTSVRASEARALLDIAQETDPNIVGSKLKQYGSNYPAKWSKKVNSIIGDKGRIPEQVYMATDDFFKMNAFAKELSVLKKAHPEKSLEELENLAAAKVRDTLPNYDKVPKGIKALREMPVGNFVAFPAEIVRTSAHILMTGVEEATSGNAVLRNRGLARLAGFVGTNLGWYTVGSAGYNLLGFTEQQNKSLNTLNEGFTKNHNKQFVNFGGKYFVHDPTYLNSYNVWQDLALTFHRELSLGKLSGESAGKRILDATYESTMKFIEPFADEAMFTTLARELLTALNDDQGRTSQGKQLFPDKNPDTVLEGTLTHLGKGLAPGFILDGIKYAEAVFETPNPTTGQKRNLTAKTIEMMTGINFNEFKPVDKFNNHVKNYLSETRYKITSPTIKFGKKGKDFFAEYTRAQGEKYKASQELFRQIEAMRDLGYSRYEVLDLLENAGVTGTTERFSLLDGKFTPDKISFQMKDQIRRKLKDVPESDVIRQLTRFSTKISNAELQPLKDFEVNEAQFIMKKMSLDDFVKQKFAEGGKVLNVEQVKESPEDRINPFTNEPYSNYEEDRDRVGLVAGSLIKKLFKQGFNKKAYHGTLGDFESFENKSSDLGIHVGTSEQAAQRLDNKVFEERMADKAQEINDELDYAFKQERNLKLKIDESKRSPMLTPEDKMNMQTSLNDIQEEIKLLEKAADLKIEDYQKGANIIPVRVKSENPLRLDDAGEWRELDSSIDYLLNSNLVKNADGSVDKITRDKLTRERRKANKVKEKYEDPRDFYTSPEAIKIRARLVNIIKSKGYDSIVYKNNIESYGVINDKDKDSLIIFEPKNIRSQFAEFDPDKSESARMLDYAGGAIRKRKSDGGKILTGLKNLGKAIVDVTTSIPFSTETKQRMGMERGQSIRNYANSIIKEAIERGAKFDIRDGQTVDHAVYSAYMNPIDSARHFIGGKMLAQSKNPELFLESANFMETNVLAGIKDHPHANKQDVYYNNLGFYDKTPFNSKEDLIQTIIEQAPNFKSAEAFKITNDSNTDVNPVGKFIFEQGDKAVKTLTKSRFNTGGKVLRALANTRR